MERLHPPCKHIHHHGIVFLAGFLVVFLLLTACAPAKPAQRVTATAQSTGSPSPTLIATVTLSPTSVPKVPAGYVAHTILQGVGRPDDLAFDLQGNLLFSDEFNGTVNRVNANGTVTTLLRGLAGPEGIVVLPDGRLIVAEQETNQILAFAPDSTNAVVVRRLPGTPSSASCKHGMDGIVYDPITRMLVLPDSPTGEVYRMSLDGKSLVRLASGMVRPVGAGVDSQGNIFIADECGNAVWRLSPAGSVTRIGGFGMPDDVISDGFGNLLIIDLAPSIHALLRLNLASGKRETLASGGFIEPQGIAMDAQGNVFVADDYANVIVKFTPGSA
jgi:sugar lactone lactonase YvrE